MTENYDEYFGKIKKHLPAYKQNHFSKFSKFKQINEKNDQAMTYFTNEKIFKHIPEEFFIKNFKISEKILNQNIENIHRTNSNVFLLF